MEFCPYCRSWFDDTNDSQPCCPGCGYPGAFEDGDGDVMVPAFDAGIDLDELLAEDLGSSDEEEEPAALPRNQTDSGSWQDDDLPY